MPDSPLVELMVTKPCFLHIDMSVHRIIMVQVGVLEPFTCDKESIASITRHTSLNNEAVDPRFSIVFTEEVTYRIIPSDE